MGWIEDRDSMGQVGSKSGKRKHGAQGQLLITVLVVVATSGCGRSGPQYAPAGGVVLFDDKPVEGAGVIFTPVGGGSVASATTDAEGRFELRTLANDGALVGDHQVTVSKGRTEEKKIPNAVMPLIRFIPEMPEKYGRRETSGLTATVSDDDSNDFTLTLTSK